MAGTAHRSNEKRKPGVTRCLAIKDDTTVCGTILNSYHGDNICYACRHRFARNLEQPTLAKLDDYLKQGGANHGG
ncbi:MAG: hypothetical protein P1P90_02105 [Patescibacteria group bacterium]|nr:hypothetical protein [Patescibacteria group bacterium]